jgi:hypothetical protein
MAQRGCIAVVEVRADQPFQRLNLGPQRPEKPGLFTHGDQQRREVLDLQRVDQVFLVLSSSSPAGATPAPATGKACGPSAWPARARGAGRLDHAHAQRLGGVARVRSFQPPGPVVIAAHSLGCIATAHLPLPYRSIVVASSNDPYCPVRLAGAYARAWGSEFVRLQGAGTSTLNPAMANGRWGWRFCSR